MEQPCRSRSVWQAASLVAALGSLAVVPLAAGRGAAPAGATATLQLNGTLSLVSIRSAPCPPGTPSGLLCPGRTGTGLVPGLGRVAESYSYLVDEASPTCALGARILGYPVRWVIAGKGEIHLTVHERTDCLGADAFTADQAFSVTGGTGIYAGATGSGTADRSLSQTEQGATGSEKWTGTLTVPGLEFDVTRPTIGGATSRTVRAPRGATRVRVGFAVTARDDTDGAVPVSCRPKSGTRFRVGRTVVTCSATDTSGNTRAAKFTVTVRRP